MTPPDAPRDLLGQITEALREYELENYAPVEENAADWLALLVQRVRTAERAPILVCESCGPVESAECHYCAGLVRASRPGEPQP